MACLQCPYAGCWQGGHSAQHLKQHGHSFCKKFIDCVFCMRYDFTYTYFQVLTWRLGTCFVRNAMISSMIPSWTACTLRPAYRQMRSKRNFSVRNVCFRDTLISISLWLSSVQETSGIFQTLGPQLSGSNRPWGRRSHFLSTWGFLTNGCFILLNILCRSSRTAQLGANLLSKCRPPMFCPQPTFAQFLFERQAQS